MKKENLELSELIQLANYLINKGNHYENEFRKYEKIFVEKFEGTNSDNSKTKNEKYFKASNKLYSLSRLKRIYREEYEKLQLQIEPQIFDEVKYSEIKKHLEVAKLESNLTYEKRQIIKMVSEKIEGETLSEKSFYVSEKLTELFNNKDIKYERGDILNITSEILGKKKTNITSALNYNSMSSTTKKRD